ncbi:hypothetical protein [Thalassolituus oleivorans]|uniref:Uncharacterized protein n=1 Tax=Thalassolituus oleivorans MIL-1 TaxID=1298593 RepID=M5DUH7_9GAMM|nr:hypothetical protein [Thalassolituus oleivorans]CCU73037.1 hypothetical protein TOL_2639 [Thalassolituus oleivorans MIL-1]
MASLRFFDFGLFGILCLFALGAGLAQADDSTVLDQSNEDLAKRVGMPFLNVSAQTTPPKTHANIPLSCLQII